MEDDCRKDSRARVLTAARSIIPSFDEGVFGKLRAGEYSRLDTDNQAYLDFTGSALYAQRQVDAHADRMRRSILGNPHSENGPSLVSTAIINEAKRRVLAFLDASPDEYTVIFTANTSAAIKLVAESYPFDEEAPLVLSVDNHNSMNGIREFAKKRNAPVHHVPLDQDLRLKNAERILRSASAKRGLFGYPAQSNFSGVQHSLHLISIAQRNGFRVLLDAAAFLPTSALSLRRYKPDFLALSMYKISGYPTGVGALVARHEALAELKRPWFAGGTVEYASVHHDSHLLRAHNGEGFEDGTPAFLSISAVADGLDLLDEIGMDRINRHVSDLAARFVDDLRRLCRKDGQPLVKIYGGDAQRGATIAFNVLDSSGRAIPFAHVVDRARNEGVSLRGGCFCNPGASEVAFNFPAHATRKCLREVSDTGFTIEKFARCVGPETAVGAVRASIGIPTNQRDLSRALSVIATFA